MTGEGEGDDEVITIDITKIPEGIETVIVVVDIYSAEKRNKKLGQVENAYVRLLNAVFIDDLKECGYSKADFYQLPDVGCNDEKIVPNSINVTKITGDAAHKSILNSFGDKPSEVVSAGIKSIPQIGQSPASGCII